AALVEAEAEGVRQRSGRGEEVHQLVAGQDRMQELFLGLVVAVAPGHAVIVVEDPDGIDRQLLGGGSLRPANFVPHAAQRGADESLHGRKLSVSRAAWTWGSRSIHHR